MGSAEGTPMSLAAAPRSTPGGGGSAPTRPRGGARLRGAAGGWAASGTLASYLGDPLPPLDV